MYIHIYMYMYLSVFLCTQNHSKMMCLKAYHYMNALREFMHLEI